MLLIYYAETQKIHLWFAFFAAWPEGVTAKSGRAGHWRVAEATSPPRFRGPIRGIWRANFSRLLGGKLRPGTARLARSIGGDFASKSFNEAKSLLVC